MCGQRPWGWGGVKVRGVRWVSSGLLRLMRKWGAGGQKIHPETPINYLTSFKILSSKRIVCRAVQY